MKEAFWGVFIILLGAIGIVAINLFQDLTVTTDHNYYLMKEATKAAMEDSLDMSYYRVQGPRDVPKPRIVKEAFVENLTRRFASSAVLNKDYTIIIHDIVEQPPKVSLSLVSNAKDIKGGKYDVLLNIDSIYEGIYGKNVTFGDDKFPFPIIGEDEDTVIIPGEDSQVYQPDGKCPNFGGEVAECISGDLQFVGWGPAPSASRNICPEDLPNLKPQQRDAKYKSCVCGKWEEPKTEVITAPPVRSGNKSTYTWNFVKNGPINNIKESIKQDVVAGICTTGIKILIKDDRPKTILDGIECPPEGITMLVGEKRTLYPRYIPLKSINRDLTWKRNTEGISLVETNPPINYPAKDNVVVIGNYGGEAIVTATSSNGKSDTCKVMVYSLDDIRCPANPVTVYSGDNVQAVLENNLILTGMTYSISNSNIATINNTGFISAKSGLSSDMNISYTINTSLKSVTCPLKILPRSSTVQPLPAYPRGSVSCYAGSIQRVSWSVNLISLCNGQIEKHSAADILKASNAKLNVRYCGHSAPITNCSSIWDRSEGIPLGGGATNARVTSSINYSTNTYTISVSAEVNRSSGGWQTGLIGCTASRTSETFDAQFTGKINHDSTSCGIIKSNEEEVGLSCPTELMLGDKAKTIGLTGKPKEGETYSIELDKTDGISLSSTSLPATIKFNSGYSGSVWVTLYDSIGEPKDKCKISLNSKYCGGVTINPKYISIPVGESETLELQSIQTGENLAQGAAWRINSGAAYAKLNCTGSLSNSCIFTGVNFDKNKTGGKTPVSVIANIESQCTTKQDATTTMYICPAEKYFCKNDYYPILVDDKCIMKTPSNSKPLCSTTQVSYNGNCYDKTSLKVANQTPAGCPSGSVVYYTGDNEFECAMFENKIDQYYCSGGSSNCKNDFVAGRGKCCTYIYSAAVAAACSSFKYYNGACYAISDKSSKKVCPSGYVSYSDFKCIKYANKVPEVWNCLDGGTLVATNRCIYSDTKPSIPKGACPPSPGTSTPTTVNYDGKCYGFEKAEVACK